MRVLLIEDDDAVADGIIDGLSARSFTVVRCSRGLDGLEQARVDPPAMVILDLGLPDIDGTEVCRRLRASTSIPIIVVSARDEEIDRVVALELGADDYLVKPFGMRELLARMTAVMRRAGAETPAPSATSRSPLQIDERTRKVQLNGVDIHLTPREFDVLAYLAQDRGAVYRRADILRDVWQTTWFGPAKTLDAHIAAVRRKLGDPRWIESVRGVGFRLGEPS